MKKFIIAILVCANSLIALYAQEQVSLTRENMSILYRNAQKAERAGDYESAVKIYKSILFVDAEQPVPYLKIANIYANNYKISDTVKIAIAMYEKYLSLLPNSKERETVINKITELRQWIAENPVDSPVVMENTNSESVVNTEQIDIDTGQTGAGTKQADVDAKQAGVDTKQANVNTKQTDVDTKQTDVDTRQTDVYMERVIDTTLGFSHIPRLPHLIVDPTIINKSKKIKNRAMKQYILNAQTYRKGNKLDSAIMCYYSVLYIDSSFFQVYKELGYVWNEYGTNTTDPVKLGYAIESFTMYLLYHDKNLKKIPKRLLEEKSTEYQDIYNIMQSIAQNKNALEEQLANYNKYLALLKSYEGMWVTYWLSKDRNQPQWVFSIEKDTESNLLCAKLHPASKSFSEDIKEQIVYPKLLPDSTLYFRFMRKQTKQPIESDYFVRHVFTEASNPKYAVAMKQRAPNVYDPQKWLEEQDKKTIQARTMINKRLEDEYNKAGIVQATEDFFIRLIDPNIPHIMHVKCIETVGDPTKIEKIKIDTLDIVCYKVPDSLTFILLGRANQRIVNHKHSKADLKTIGFTKWNRLSITGEVAKHLGIVSLFGISIGLSSATASASTISLEIYRTSMQVFPDYLLSIGKEGNRRNPRRWNNKMLNMLIQYYDAKDKLDLKSAAPEEPKELTEKEKKAPEKEKKSKTKKQRKEKAETSNQIKNIIK